MIFDGYVRKAILHDIAILTIHDEFEFSPYIKSIELARENDEPKSENKE